MYSVDTSLPTFWELDCLDALEARRRRLLRISRMKGSLLVPRAPGESEGVIVLLKSSLILYEHNHIVLILTMLGDLKKKKKFIWVGGGEWGRQV